MKIFRFLAVALFLAGLSACATTKDLNRTQADLDQKIKIVDEKVISADQTNQALKKDVDSNRASVTGLLKRQADTGADLTEIREQMQQLRGRLESMQKDDGEYKKSELTELRQQIQQLRSQVESLQKKNEEFENSKQRLDQVALKIKFLNDYLGIDENSPRGKGAKGEAQAKAAGTETSRYAAASALFKDGKYGQARSEFQSYLKTNPKAADAAKAQFLIGEI